MSDLGGARTESLASHRPGTGHVTLGEMEMQEEPPTALDWTPTKHERAIIYTLGALNLIVALDATVIVTSLPQISLSLGATTTQALWIGTSYLLVNAVSMPFICSVSDVIGRPICLTFSVFAFTVGTILCCTARGIAVMLVGRSIQGVGGGGIHSLSLVVLTDFIPLRWRPKFYGVTLAFWAMGLCGGPIIGGAIAERTTWRWIFYLMFPVCAFGLVAVPYLLTLRPKKATAQEKMSRIDWIGGFLFMGSGTIFLMAITWGGTEHPWNSVATLVPLILGFVGIVITVVYEMKYAQNPFLRKNLFTDFSSVVTYIAAALQGLILYGQLYYSPFYFLSVKNYSPIIAGVALLPVQVTFTLAGIVAGRVISAYNSFRWVIWLGWLLSCVATAMYTSWAVDDSKPVWILSLIIGGTAHGLILTAQNFATQAMCRPGDEGAAAAFYIFARQFGVAFGVGVGATTFENSMKQRLAADGLPTSIATNSETYLPTLHALPDGPRKDSILHAYRFGFQVIFAVWLGISVLLLFCTLLFIKHADMNRKLQTDHTLDSQRVERHWGGKKTVNGGKG
ncbi:MFS general substrate transporter [Xylariaceae sp. FL0804]|nr:MFS general substrate transporter [Xylariaceae sp. FL0804]